MGHPTEKRQTGDRGEEAVTRHLQQQGYTILARNWHCRWGELDIVATRDDIIAFVEVKTRRQGAMVSPFAAVDYRKQRRVICSAQAYLQAHPLDLQPRFDVAGVTTGGGTLGVDYLESAFDASAAR